MHWDFSVNIANCLTFVAATLGLLWKASQFVAEMKAFRERYEAHVIEVTERFERAEARIEDLRLFALGRHKSA